MDKQHAGKDRANLVPLIIVVAGMPLLLYGWGMILMGSCMAVGMIVGRLVARQRVPPQLLLALWLGLAWQVALLPLWARMRAT